MGLVPFKSFGLVFLFAVGIASAWMFGNGFLTWHETKYACYGGAGLVSAGDKVTWLWVGPLRLKYQPLMMDCIPERRFDPQQYHMVNDQLVPK